MTTCKMSTAESEEQNGKNLQDVTTVLDPITTIISEPWQTSPLQSNLSPLSVGHVLEETVQKQPYDKHCQKPQITW